MLSIVIPIHNEEPAILPLYDRLTTVLDKLNAPYEILFVDDASTDRSFELLANWQRPMSFEGAAFPAQLRPNGRPGGWFDEAQGEVIVSWMAI